MKHKDSTSGDLHAGPGAAPDVIKAVFHDADEQAVQVRGWDTCYQQMTPGPFYGQLFEAWIGDMQVFRETTNQAILQRGAGRAGSLSFGIPLALSKPVTWRGTPVTSGAIGCFRSDEELDMCTPPDFDLVVVSLNPDDFFAFAEQVEGKDVRRLIHGKSVAHVSAARKELLTQVLLTVTRSIGDNPALLADERVRRSLREAVYGTLVAAMESDNAYPVPGSTRQRSRIVAQAQEYLRCHVDEPISIADLCETLGVSRRTLQYGFQEVLGINPVRYLRAIRLNGVRRELKSGKPHIAVQDVAARWGFWHLSHFSADYREMFRELPSDTLRRHSPVLP